MTPLPQDITERFYKTIIGDISLVDFEQWLYANKELEKYLSADDYLALISLGYQESGTKYELSNLLKKHIDLGALEKFKILGLLKEAKLKTERLPYILMEFYELYSKGYNFLEDLGLGFGLQVEIPRVMNTTADTWDELTKAQQKKLLTSFSPGLEICLDQVIYWFESEKIVLTGEQDNIGLYYYEDFRTEEEKKSNLYLANLADYDGGYSNSKHEDCVKQPAKKWWEFWK